MTGDLAIWHASVVELIWTLLGIIGMYFGTKNLRSSREDIEALRRMNGSALAKHQVMKVVAYGHYRNDCFRLAKHTTIFFIGIIAMILPPQVPTSQVSPTGIVITGGLFAISILLVLASALDKRQRDVLEDMDD